MKTIFKIYLISFLATSITYGIMTYAFNYYNRFNNNDNILWQSIISAVLFGLIMSVFFSVMQKRRLKKQGIPN